MAVASPDVVGLASHQQRLYDTASQLRERLSLDNWRSLNKMVQRKTNTAAPSQAEAMRILDDAAETSMLLSGYAMDGMNRDLGWRFLSLGRRIERLQFQCQLHLRALAMDADGDLEWLLELSDSIVTYRARYQSQPEWLPVLDLLVLDKTNPRSIVFQVDGIQKTLQQLAMSYASKKIDDLTSFQAELAALNPQMHLNTGNLQLQNLFERLMAASMHLSEQIGVQFFSHTA